MRLFSVSEGFDMPILIILLLIMVIGLVALFSSSHVYALYQYDDSFYIIRRQLIFTVAGIVIMLLVSMIDYHILHRFAFVLMAISIALLVIVLFMEPIAFVNRWIKIPVLGQFQPSEIAKFSLIVLFSHLISMKENTMKKFLSGYLPFMLILGLTCALVIIEPHLSGTLLMLGIGISMMFVGGTRLIYILSTVLLGSGAVGTMIFVLGYERERINVWLKPFEMYAGTTTERNAAWQTVQSLYAIGSGGLMGLGLGNSVQKHLFLPEGHNDFIFAVFCEEMGFIGAAVVIILFALLVWRGISISTRAADKFGSMLAFGLTIQIGIQAFLNIAVVTNTMPNTGISLPFFSYGGTSLIMLLAQMGVVLSVSRSVNRDQDKRLAKHA